MMETHERKFTGFWMPRDIWEHPDLLPLEKFLWAEILSFEGKDGCYASNKYLAKILRCSEKYIGKMVKKLKDLRLIYQHSFDGRRRYLKTYQKHKKEKV